MRAYSSGSFFSYRLWKMAKIEHPKIDDNCENDDVHAQMLIYSMRKKVKSTTRNGSAHCNGNIWLVESDPQHGKNLDVRYVRSQGRTSEIIHSQFTNNLDDLLSGGIFYDSQ